jgi:CheY-like chemotaxis protein
MVAILSHPSALLGRSVPGEGAQASIETANTPFEWCTSIHEFQIRTGSRMGCVAGARVLVVEDADAIRVAVQAGLTSAGYAVLSKPDGQALERDLTVFRPDLVVLDVMLPGRDGFALLEVIRQSSAAGVVMLTARDGVADRLHGLTQGADDYAPRRRCRSVTRLSTRKPAWYCAASSASS